MGRPRVRDSERQVPTDSPQNDMIDSPLNSVSRERDASKSLIDDCANQLVEPVGLLR